MQAHLTPLDGGPTIPITRDITVVGRQEGVCDLVIDRGSISKLHCLIVRTDGLLFVRDLGSTNGTKVNGQRISRGVLLPGDELAFASLRFRVFLGPAVRAESQDDNTARTEMIPAFSNNPSERDDEVFGEPLDAGEIVAGEYYDMADSESDVRLLPDDSVV